MAQKWIYFFIISILTLSSTGVFAVVDCRNSGSIISSEAEELADEIAVIAGEVATKVLAIKVNYDGTGTVKVLTDDAGNLIGVRLDYKDSKGHTMQQTRTVAEFNKGQSVAFEMEGQVNSPLMLKTKSGTILSNKNGGPFTFSLLTSNDPIKYAHYQLTLVKVGSAWKVMKDNKAITNTVISPNISWSMSWEGTFKSATFQ
jgi:hypothetical protein